MTYQYMELKIKELEKRIEALEQEPTYYPPCIDCNKKMDEIRHAYDKLKEQESSGDLISRQELLEDLYKRDYTKFTHRDFVALVQYQDTVQQEPKTGHWYRQTNDFVDYYECSECGMAIGLYDVKNYCPNCGSRNEVEE